MNDNYDVFFSGQLLFGDDFSDDQIRNWYKEEEEGYANIGKKGIGNYSYVYHELNRQLGFNNIPKKKFEKTLGIGSAYGDEFIPIANYLSKIVILEPSDVFSQKKEILGLPITYEKPTVQGKILFPDNYFDLISCLGSLHHIPNVSFIVGESYRVLKSNGYMLLREPIVSMGDWRRSRQGLTKNERGIPLCLLRNIIKNAGFEILHENLCVFRPLAILSSKVGVPAYGSRLVTFIDRVLSRMFSWNYRYHRISFFEKLAPVSAYYVLKK